MNLQKDSFQFDRLIIKSYHLQILQNYNKSKMDFLKGLGNIFKGRPGNEQIISYPPSKLKGKMIKDYVFQNQIVQFQNPPTQLVQGVKEKSTRVSIYALQKNLLKQDFFIAYQNNLANNYYKIYPQYLEHVQSSNFIYLILEDLSVPELISWMLEDFLSQIQQFAQRVKQKLQLKGLLVTKNKKLCYLPPYQDLRNISKLYYEGINKSTFAELFFKVFQMPENYKQKIFDKIVQYAGTNQLKAQVLDLLASIQKQQAKKSNNFQKIAQNKFQKMKLPNNNNYFKQNQFDKSQTNEKKEDAHYSDISVEDDQIMKLLSGVKVNPKLFLSEQISNMRASTRTRHENQIEMQQIKNMIDNTNKSVFEINKVVKKSNMKSNFDNKNQKQSSNNRFEVYCSTYIQIFKHLKRTVKSTLEFYSQGYSGIINAYFITLIGILRRSRLIYQLHYSFDVFQIGCSYYNVQFYTGKLKSQLVSQAKILTDLREMVFKCIIPMNTLKILEPFLDDHIQKIDPVKLEDFTFFYMTCLIKSNFQQNMHFINLIECMYIILHRNFEVVHFESDMPKKWDGEFFNQRKCLIASMVPGWNI